MITLLTAYKIKKKIRFRDLVSYGMKIKETSFESKEIYYDSVPMDNILAIFS